MPIPLVSFRPHQAGHDLRPDPVFIIGMHRSGTSALGLILEKLGLSLGKKVMSPQMENPKGYAENFSLMEFHDKFLKYMGSNWQDAKPLDETRFEGEAARRFREELLQVLAKEFGQGRPLIKDPRMCRLMPLWLPLIREHFPKASFILPIRHPVEVARAVKRDRQLTMEEGLKLWVIHVIEGERTTRGLSRKFTTYEQLMQTPVETVLPLARELGLSADALSAAVANIIDVRLWHNKDQSWPEGEPHKDLTLSIHQALVAGAADMEEKLEALRQEYYGHMSWLD